MKKFLASILMTLFLGMAFGAFSDTTSNVYAISVDDKKKDDKKKDPPGPPPVREKDKPKGDDREKKDKRPV